MTAFNLSDLTFGDAASASENANYTTLKVACAKPVSMQSAAVQGTAPESDSAFWSRRHTPVCKLYASVQRACKHIFNYTVDRCMQL